MADLSDNNSALNVKLIGADSSGIETNPVDATVNGLKVDGSAVTQPVSDAGGSLTVDQATAANFNAQVVGNVASSATDSGNPVKVGGVYNSTPPTFTNGQRADIQLSSRGSVHAAGLGSTGAAPQNNPVYVAGIDTGGNKLGLYADTRGALITTELYSHSRVSGATTVTIKSGAGLLKRIVINRPTNGTYTFYNNTTATGTPILFIAATNGTAPTTLEYGFTFSTGLTITTTGANTELSILYL